MKFFIDAFCEFDDEDRDSNSIEFAYWMNGTNYAEAVRMQREHKMSLKAWQQCHGDPWRQMQADYYDFSRPADSITRVTMTKAQRTVALPARERPPDRALLSTVVKGG